MIEQQIIFASGKDTAGEYFLWPKSITRGNVGSRAGKGGGTREPSSQKEFGLAESFLGFEIFTKLNSNMFLKFLPKLFVLHRIYQFL